MNLFTLPDDFTPGRHQSPPPIAVQNYFSAGSGQTTKIRLRYPVFSFLREGEKSVFYPQRQAHIGNDHFLMLPAHRCVMAEKQTGRQRYHSILFYFSPQLLTSRESLPGHTPATDTRPVTPVAIAYDDYLNRFAESLLHAPEDEDFLRLKLEELLQYLRRRFPQQLSLFLRQTISPEESLLRDIVNRNVLSGLSVEELAFLCHMSVATFRRHFSRIYGISPREWLKRERMKLAARALAGEGKSPSQIYGKLGFANPSAFGRAFRRHFGQTPGEYRRRMSDREHNLSD
ncbi:MAG TPA: AraC family transcriptional regulator [Caldithrix abyssi]|uniref:AraC family transcriptional regulator n=1 Tax=Caldithrix abyssi TaxID=187145 RepID=A0A7V5RQS7_CALAY|nr:AraC family transcriptional regulator [Caldithrix abyssi]